jgi:hypothetical protein
MGVYAKLMAVQTELKAPKGQYNSFGKYKYRSCEDILEAVKPLLAKHKAVVTICDDLDKIGDRYYIRTTAIFTDIETGEQVSTLAYAREEESKKGMDGSQVTGASSSYARKYALNGLFCIDDTKDSDGTNAHDKEDDDAKESKPEPQQKKQTEQPIYRCAVCSKPISKKYYDQSKEKYGTPLCSTECAAKAGIEI